MFFEYQAKHTSAAASETFRGYSGYLRADAHAICDALFKGDSSGSDPPPNEVSAALGYGVRPSQPLQQFLDNARLMMTHNSSERGLRVIANIFSLIASCRLHDVDPELYLREIIHGMPYWPKDRFLELC
ncbi:MAG: transposase domain-containing protein [Deltaproteobacteria bacterium]|nr:transposase domain-containing protein [Deltaproteobacteria bacterium]